MSYSYFQIQRLQTLPGSSNQQNVTNSFYTNYFEELGSDLTVFFSTSYHVFFSNFSYLCPCKLNKTYQTTELHIPHFRKLVKKTFFFRSLCDFL